MVFRIQPPNKNILYAVAGICMCVCVCGCLCVCAHLLNIIALILCDTWHFLLPRNKVVIVIVIVVTVVVAALVLAVVSGTYM